MNKSSGDLHGGSGLHGFLRFFFVLTSPLRVAPGSVCFVVFYEFLFGFVVVLYFFVEFCSLVLFDYWVFSNFDSMLIRYLCLECFV